MIRLRDDLKLDGVPVVRLESDQLQVDVAPSVGGRIVSIVEKSSGHEFLWRNRSVPVRRSESGSEYDSNFFGGIDELLPNDMPETIQGVNCPDHGELWTTSLNWEIDGQRLKLHGTLPLFGLAYEREICLRSDGPWLDLSYRLSNPTRDARVFLWKLHAALAVAPGDLIDCPAQKAQVVDLAWSRYRTMVPFDWPMIEGKDASKIPAPDGTVDFFYLFDLAEGRIGWHRPGANLEFAYQFDTTIFSYAWLFASYGGFFGHYTAVLEPCTAMPMPVNEAAAKKQCSRLEPGESLVTNVSLYAGPARSAGRSVGAV